MSGEIVPVLDASGSSFDEVEDSLSETSSVDNGQDDSTSNANRCTSVEREAIPAIDLLDSRTFLNPEVEVDLIGGDYHTREFLASEKGHKYVKQFNPTLDSVEPLLRKMKEPSVLLLRGCDLLLRPAADFPFGKFKALTALEISGCTHLTALAENTISEMTQLQSLHLSHLPIKQLPEDLFSNLANLRSLILRGCSNLHLLPQPPLLNELECLDLSHLPIETLPDGFLSSRLRSLILRGCSKLHSLPSTRGMFRLTFLDLFQCTSLQTLEPIKHTVQVLDLSYTTLGWAHVPITSFKLTHLYFRNAQVSNPNESEYVHLSYLRVCDLSGAQNLEDVNMLTTCTSLVALDLSRTGIKSIGFLWRLTYLRTLILRECTRLRELSSIERLKNLQVLDVSGCRNLADLPRGLSKQRRLKELNLCGCSGLRGLREGLFDHMPSLEKLDLSKTNLKNLPSFANLINLRTLNLPDDDTPADLSNLINLGIDRVDSTGAHSSGLGNHPGEISNSHELHLVSTFITDSRFDRFKYKFTELDDHISVLERNYEDRITASTTSVVDTAVATSTQALKKQFEILRADLQYILDKIDLLEYSHNRTSCEQLLQGLMNYEYGYSIDYSTKLNKLLRMVAKLKLLVPPPPNQVRVMEDTMKKKPLPRNEYKEEPYAYKVYLETTERQLVSPYESLTNIQRNCLLYFACLPAPVWGNKPIKESILIHLWYGEGFFDQLLYAASSTKYPLPKMVLSTKDSAATNDANTIEEIGRETLQILQEKGFIQIRQGKKWHMENAVHSFVSKRARAEHLFDFNEYGKLTPHITVSQRACLLKSEDNCMSSSGVWLDYSKSSEKLDAFKNMRALLYIDEAVVHIKTEWFSAMRNLSVLHLVNLWPTNEEQIDIVDVHFLEELKNMTQLRLLSLEGFSAIQKLPNSVCKLTNLAILKLRYCTNLEELPAGIGSLVNLIYLDLTQCHLLNELPKGLTSLSKLEVLKGFVINYEVSGQKSRKACTLRELLKLESLRKLNLVVNKDSFPRTEDLRVFKEMKNLCSLNITWKENYDEVQEEALMHSRWKQLKCWKPQTVLHDDTEEEEPFRSNLQKLVLCCFRSETAPSWLRPSELQKLEKLYIVGGNLKTLSEDGTNQTTWKVKTLHLKYLSNLDMDWLILKGFFPDMTSFRKLECPCIRNFTGTRDVWTAESEGSQ